VVAEGPRAAAQQLLELLSVAHGHGRPGRVDGVVERWDVARGGLVGFRER
jgi:acylphosphatase